MKSFTRMSVGIALVAALLVGTPVLAHSNGKKHDDNRSSVSIPFHKKLMVNATGNISLNGTVKSVAPSSFVVESWGGLWTVTVNADTKFGANLGTSSIKVGNEVYVKGAASTSNLTIVASRVDDTTSIKTLAQQKKDGKKLEKELSKFQKNLKGSATVQSTASSSLSVKGKKGTYTVSTDANTKVYSKSWTPLSFADIKVGHVVETFGSTTSATNVHAALILDLSL
jgi:hypothetical protein